MNIKARTNDENALTLLDAGRYVPEEIDGYLLLLWEVDPHVHLEERVDLRFRAVEIKKS